MGKACPSARLFLFAAPNRYLSAVKYLVRFFMVIGDISSAVKHIYLADSGVCALAGTLTGVGRNMPSQDV